MLPGAHYLDCWFYYYEREEVGHGLSFLYWPWYDSVMFSGGAFLCYGPGIVCKGKAAFRAINGRDQWWYAPGKVGCLNLGMAVSLDWDWFI